MVEKNSDIAILGRIVLNLWRLLRFEVLSMIPLISFVSIFAVKKKKKSREIFITDCSSELHVRKYGFSHTSPASSAFHF